MIGNMHIMTYMVPRVYDIMLGVSIGGDPACYIVENHLSRFVEGQVQRHRHTCS